MIAAIQTAKFESHKATIGKVDVLFQLVCKSDISWKDIKVVIQQNQQYADDITNYTTTNFPNLESQVKKLQAMSRMLDRVVLQDSFKVEEDAIKQFVSLLTND